MHQVAPPGRNLACYGTIYERGGVEARCPWGNRVGQGVRRQPLTRARSKHEMMGPASTP